MVFFIPPIDSRFQGFFVRLGKKNFKILDEVSSKNKLNFSLHNDCLIVSAPKVSKIDLFFDIKEAYDNDDFGKLYELKHENKNLILHFRKQSDDKTLFSMFVVIPNVKSDEVSKWVKKSSSFDKNRNSPPFERYVFHAVSLESKKLVISVSQNLDEAISNAFNASKVKLTKSVFQPKFDIKDKEVKKAYISAVNSLNQLTTKEGILAGFPWFFQNWTRDELISSIGLIKSGRSVFVKEFILNSLSHIKKDGRLENITNPPSNVTNADSIGWLFFRASQLHLSKAEKKELSYSLQYSIFEIFKNYSDNRIIRNNPKETWMDTEWDGDNRAGFRVEIQALFLHMLHFAHELSGKQKFLELEYTAKFVVKNALFKDGYLWDGLDDPTIRPNLFIAAYVYPQLLDKEDWVDCFEKVLPSLWLDWGGLSTIDKNHNLFCHNHTGENVQSYHRGDSWFWINNLAAIVMHRFDKRKFSKYIKNILKASAQEINHLGIQGCAAELSSASALKSEGCQSQAWSAALFIELVHELYS